MKKQLLFALGLATALTSPVLAEGVPGWYAGVEGGITFPSNQTTRELGGAGSTFVVNPKSGWTGGVFAGYDFVGPRVELEGGYRHSKISGIFGAPGTGNTSVWSGLLNLYYDFDFGSKLVPYVGAGAGVARVKDKNVGPWPNGGVIDGGDTRFAYQGVVGVKYALNDNWAIRVDARYFATEDPSYTATGPGVRAKSEYDDVTAMVGILYKFGKAAAPAPVAEAAPPPPPPASAAAPPPAVNMGPYMVFFDWNKSDITPDAEKILQDAAAAAKQGQIVHIELGGHADRSGSASYNMGLSQRRADAVKAELGRLGADNSGVDTHAYGETEPLVPTKDGVREPQNRRVEITFPKP